jgi:hypothetical protein
MLIIFLDIKGTVQMESSSLAKQSIPHITMTFYGDRMKICKYFTAKFSDKSWLLHHDSASSPTSFFIREFFTKINMTVVTHQPY